MKINTLFKTLSILSISALWLISSCEEDERITTQDTQDISEEALTDSYFQDLDDMAGVAVLSDEVTSGGRAPIGGRDIVIQDDRLDCDGITVRLEPTDTNPDRPKGRIEVDFGDSGCTDGRGNVRKGKIIFTYDGRRFLPGSSIVTSVENYYINGVRLEGTRTITNQTGSTTAAPTWNVKLDNGKATFEDETFATRQSNITATWVRETNPVNDRLVIDVASTASGTTRGGRSYEVSLVEPLEYKRFCGFAVKGIKRYLIDGKKEIIIDYGDGECDRSVTISVNGATRKLVVGK